MSCHVTSRHANPESVYCGASALRKQHCFHLQSCNFYFLFWSCECKLRKLVWPLSQPQLPFQSTGIGEIRKPRQFVTWPQRSKALAPCFRKHPGVHNQKKPRSISRLGIHLICSRDFPRIDHFSNLISQEHSLFVSMWLRDLNISESQIKCIGFYGKFVL